MIKVAVSGSAGRMGSAIIRLLKEDPRFKLAVCLERAGHPFLEKDIGSCLGLGNLKVKVGCECAVIKDADVVIEFTNPQATIEHLEYVSKFKKAMVIGTTGLRQEDQDKISKAANKIPIVLSPNMSLGVNLLFGLLAKAGSVLGLDYDAEIIEAHHKAKVDAPSGTAKRFEQLLAKVRGRQVPVHAIRAGDIVGDHTIIFAGKGERIEFIHRAHSRDTFAKGALLAASWIIGKPAGLYDMLDVLGIK